MSRPTCPTTPRRALARDALSARALAALALGAHLAGCSRPDEPQWPERNYSGVYAVRARVDSNSCPAAVFSETDTLRFTLIQYPDNRARMDIPPVVSIPGRFVGDRLEARAAVSDAPGSLAPADAGPPPPGAAGERAALAESAPAEPAAGADSLRYTLELDFEKRAFSGRYVVEQPALGEGAEACRQEFAVEGEQLPGG